MRRVSSFATEILPADAYLSPDWYELRRDTVSASEVAAILGLSPWVSAFDLWWEKRTGQPSQDETRAMSRGKRREQAIREDFGDEHMGDLWTQPVGLIRNDEREWQTCTPDALVYEGEALAAWEFELLNGPPDYLEPVAVLEAKTDGGSGGWGEDGSDEIPVYYRTQVLWQMDCVGVNVAYLPVWHGFGYKEYAVEYHEADVLLMRAAAEEFLTSVREDRQPDVDSHKATGRRLRKLHPDLVDDWSPVPASYVRQYQAAARLKRAAEDRMRLNEHRIRRALGDAAEGRVDGRKAVTRSIYEVAEHVRRASTTDRLNVTRKEIGT